MRRVVNRMPEAQGWIAGPADEDPAYAEECRNLVDSLGLSDNVTYFAEQVEPDKASQYQYRVVFKPLAIVPDIEIRK